MPVTPFYTRLVTLVAGMSACLLTASDFRIDSIATEAGRSEVRFPGDTGFFYTLWRGDSVTDIRLATDLALSSGAQSLLTDTNATNSAQFYRVEKVSLTSLRDTDGDGISDAWELLYRNFGAALNPADANEDQDGNGVPDSTDSLRESLREGGVRGRPVIAAGVYHSLAIRKDGTLWGWGDNLVGELGVTGLTETNNPALVTGHSNWVAVSSGSLASYGLKSDGTLWTWGQSNIGVVLMPVQIGTNTDWITLPKQSLYLEPTALRGNGTLWQLFGTGTNLQQVGSDDDWSAATDDRSTGHWGIKRDGTLWKELTMFDTNRSWASISVGDYHALALRTDGTLWAWMTTCCGGTGGQLGLGNSFPSLPTQVGTGTWAAVSAGGNHSVGIKNDGSLWWWGSNWGFDPDVTHLVQTNVPVRFGTNTDWIAVSAGVSHTIALRGDGIVWTFGYNELGKLGNGTPAVIKEPMRVGDDQDWISVATGTSSSFGLKTNGTLWAWGANLYGVVGAGDFSSSSAPRQVPGSNWVAVSGGGDHTAALQNDGSLWVWGKYIRSTTNRLADIFTNQPTQLGTNTDWLRISAGFRHALGVRQDSTLWAWGSGDNGALGNGTFFDIQNVPIQIQTPSNGPLGWSNVSAGYYSSAGLRYSGSTLWNWGRSIGTLFTSLQPQTGINGSGWANIALAKYHLVSPHALALKRNGTLWSCGVNFSGQLGTNNSNGNLLQVGTFTNWSAIAVGDQFSGALQTDGTLWMTGANFHGQLGFGTRIGTNMFTPTGIDANWTSLAAGTRHTLALKADGSIWAWGDNSYGQCAQPALFEPAPVAGTNWGKPH